MKVRVLICIYPVNISMKFCHRTLAVKTLDPSVYYYCQLLLGNSSHNLKYSTFNESAGGFVIIRSRIAPMTYYALRQMINLILIISHL